MPHVIDPRFRDRLVTLMKGADISAKTLAAKVPMQRSYLSEIINGRKMPSEDMARKIDQALNAGGQLANLVGVATLAGDRDHLADAAVFPHRISDTTLDALSRILNAQRYLEDSVGAAAVIGPVLPQLDTILAMARSARGTIRTRALYVAGQWAQYAGWLYTSLGEWDEARVWNGRALEWAVEIADPDLTATVLSYQAHVAWLNLHVGTTIGLARAALRDERVYPGQRAYDALQAARGYAYSGDIIEAERLLEAADRIIDQVDVWDGETPPWQYYREPWLWELERGLVHLYLNRWERGHAERAVAHLCTGYHGMPEQMHASDWAAEYRVHLANAYVKADAPHTAREVLAGARQVAEATESRRVLYRVVDLERQLRDAI
ncbi:helix-turn-helix transcriptional regulator [Planosporangium thailandense]|uniref:Helix-turn-helix transcriptional regulator n=1 Tax=Planosporangium thailandense TaxID=765197 RepID=A0ABX0Y0B9_9ACTN|nr:helix-turn-helix transcriptional regulator [Planosporangium thailandense]NJC70868.1 helix-turn-helix transcriptional regulator [Planosporangium thailandense]